MSSTPKEILFEEEARRKLSQGIDKLFDVVSVTLGPKGKNIGLESSFGSPTITSDGNQIIGDLELKDQYLNMGVSLAKEVAEKIKEKSGDGTTRAIILLQALVSHGIKNIASGASPIAIKRGFDKALNLILKEIEKISHKINTQEEIKNIATASASGDELIGSIIAQAFEKAGLEGVITIEEGKSTETTIDIVEGMQFDRGYLSSYFCTNPENMTVELSNAKVLVTDKKISSIHEIMNLLQSTAAGASELLIIADDIEGDALSTLVVNRLRGTLKVAAVKAPGFGDRRKQMLQDIAVLTNATLVSEDKGMQLKDANTEVLGSCEKIKITKDSTTLVGGSGSEESIKLRIQEIENEYQQTTSSYDKEKLLERKAKLSGGVAVISVGAPSEPEMKHKKQLFEDSLNSTQAALEEGVVPGGCISLLKISQGLKNSDNFDKEEKVGLNIVLKACEAPFRQLVKNSGLEDSLLLEQVLSGDFNLGFNTVTEKVEDMIKAGITDPAKVIKNVISHACSMAGVILLSEALIGDFEESDDKK